MLFALFKRDEVNILCERVVDTARMNDDRNFWSEVKRIRSSKPDTVRIVPYTVFQKKHPLILLAIS